MKRIGFVLIAALVLFVALTAEACHSPPTAREQAEAASAEIASSAIESIPIPQVSYFQERRTITKWAAYWDKPNLPTYVYLFVFDKCLGYYVADGKPASTRSYVVPEQSLQYTRPSLSSSYYAEVLPSPDIDGTYGDNNPGIRFFTADGNPVEWGGAGASYLYSAYPLPIDVPKLNHK